MTTAPARRRIDTVTSPDMLPCPHCGAPLSRADLTSQRFLRPRHCPACGGEYIEGGTRVAMGIVGGGVALATSIGSLLSVPTWLPPVLAIGSALVAVRYTQTQPPRPANTLRGTLLSTVVIAPLTAMVVWQILKLFGRP